MVADVFFEFILKLQWFRGHLTLRRLAEAGLRYFQHTHFALVEILLRIFQVQMEYGLF
jgi:hypothetical protein